MSILKDKAVEDAAEGVVTLESDINLTTAIRLMDEKDQECIVATENGKPVGILTQRDIIKLIVQKPNLEGTLLKDVMNRRLITIDHDATIEKALKLMEEKKINHILVMKNDTLIGIIDSQRIRSLNLIDALSIFTISAHSHYTPYLYGKIAEGYEELISKLKDEIDIQKIVKIISDELQERGLVDEITIEQLDDEIKIKVKDCMYSRTIHPFIEEGKEVCVLGLLTAMILQKVTGRRMRFVDFSDITETDSETRLIVK